MAEQSLADVRTAASVFLRCPLLPDKYPRQPVLRCDLYRPPVLEIDAPLGTNRGCHPTANRPAQKLGGMV